MPAAKSTGRMSTAYQGRLPQRRRRRLTSSPTSVTVSKPRPKSSPTGYMCQDVRTVRVTRPRIRLSRPRLSSWGLELGLVVVTGTHASEDLEDPDERGEVDEADEDEEDAGDRGAPDTPSPAGGSSCRPRDRAGQRTDAEGDERDHDEDDRRVAEAEPESDAIGTLALGHELARSCCRWPRCVVGVERVPHAEGVGRDPSPTPKSWPATGTGACATTPTSRPQPMRCSTRMTAAMPSRLRARCGRAYGSRRSGGGGEGRRSDFVTDPR